MSPFSKLLSLRRGSQGCIGDQSVHPAPEKLRLLDGGGGAKEVAEEEEGEKPEAFDSRRSRRSILKKLLLIRGGERRKKRAHLAVYIGEELQRFEVPIEYFHYEGFAALLQECRDADALDFNINLPIEIESCSVERFRRIWRDAEEELRRRWRL